MLTEEQIRELAEELMQEVLAASHLPQPARVRWLLQMLDAAYASRTALGWNGKTFD